MANVGEIHLTGAAPWEPKAREIFKVALDKFKDEPDKAEFLAQLVVVQDIAEKSYMEALHAAAGKFPDKFQEVWEAEAPICARLKILDTLIGWNEACAKGKSPRKRRR